MNTRNKNNDLILYKYTSCEGLDSILNDSRLKITNPVDFNDPFDCSLPTFKHDDTLYKRKIFNEFKRYYPGIKPTNDFGKIVEEVLLGLRNIFIDGNKDWFDLVQQFRVLSLSEGTRNIPMWSHYANQHKGVAIGFKRTGIFREAKKVDYDIKLGHTHNFFDDLVTKNIKSCFDHTKISEDYILNKALKFFFIKHEQWQHEQEYRLVLPINDEKIVTESDKTYIGFNKDDVCEVIFGIKVTKEQINSINQKLCKTWKHASLRIVSQEYNNLVIKPYEHC